MLGATGAVGREVVRALQAGGTFASLTLLGRRSADHLKGDRTTQEVVDVFDISSYREQLAGRNAAVCTFGVGQPSKMSREEFLRIDKAPVLSFARACKEAGVEHFELLGSVGSSSGSRSFYLRTKGELEDELVALGFRRLSIFRPSMILTPENRYGLSQALTLAVWPRLKPILAGPLRKYRGVRVERLGAAIAHNLTTPGDGVERLHWDQIERLADG